MEVSWQNATFLIFLRKLTSAICPHEFKLKRGHDIKTNYEHKIGPRAEINFSTLNSETSPVLKLHPN